MNEELRYLVQNRERGEGTRGYQINRKIANKLLGAYKLLLEYCAATVSL